MAIELPAEDFQKVPEEAKDAIEERMKNTERVMLKRISYLEGKGYSAAVRYINNARHSMFGYVRRWLKWGARFPQDIIHGRTGNERVRQTLEKHCLRVE